MKTTYIDSNGNLVTPSSNSSSKNTYTYIDDNGNLASAEVPVAPVSKKKKKKNNWINLGAFDDGYDFGDVTKTILGTSADVGTSFLKGVSDVGAGAGKLAVGGIAQGADWLGYDEYANKLRKSLAGQNKKTNEWLENYTPSGLFEKANKKLDKYSVSGEKLDKINESIGQIAGYGAASSIAPILGTSAMFGSAAGENLSEAYSKEGVTDKQAWAKAIGSGAIEVATERLFGLFSKRGLDTDLANKISSKLSNGMAKVLTRQGIQATAEGTEEVISYASNQLLDMGIDKLSGKDAAKFYNKWNWEEVGEQFASAAIASGIVGTGQTALNVKNIKKEKEINTNQAINEYAKQQDISEGVLTKNEQKVVDKEVQNRIKEQTADGKELTKKEKNKIEKQVKTDLEKGRISIDTIEEALGDNSYKQYKNIQEQKNNIQEKINEYKKMKDNDITVEQREEYNKLKEELSNINEKSYKEQLSQYVDNLTKNDYLLRTSYNEKANKSVAFDADLSKYNDKQKAVVQKAIDSGVLNNTNRSHELVDLVAKLAEDKGMDFDFVNNEKLKDTGFALEGKQVNGYNTGSSIGINIDSNKALNSIIGHEITHVIEDTDLYNELQNSIMEYAKTKGEYDTRLKELQELYKDVKDANVENELTSDLVGDYLFTDEDFVNRLYNNNKNVFQKIYDEIKYFIKQIAPGSKESKQLEQVKRAFEKAYRNSIVKNAEKTNNPQIKYSIEEKGAIENLNNIDGFEVQEDTYPYDNVIGHSFDLKTKEGIAHLQIRETEDKVYLNMINTRLGNSTVEKGAGTKILNNLKDYCDKTGKQLVIAGEVSSASGFYDKFNWLTKENGKIIDDEGNLFDINSPNRIYNPGNKTKYSISTDSNGRELSKQQQEYFKDSKVRDDEGKLLEVYHGSPNEFTIFDKGKMKTGATLYASSGDGFYFTDSEAKANKYSKNGYKYSTYLNITNPFVVENNITPEANDVLTEFSKQVINNHPESTQKDFGAYELFDKNDIGQKSGTAILSGVVSEYGNEFTDFLKSKGYDGIKSSVIDYDNFGEKYNYVAFYSNQIKNIDNTNPTSNEDIRYSLSEQNKKIAPVGNYQIKGEDVKLEKIAPVKETKTEIKPKAEKKTTKLKDISIPMAKQDNVLKVTAQDIAKQINNSGDFDIKQRSWAKTSTESEPLKGKVFIEDLDPSKITYEVQSNKKSLDKANKHLDTYGYEKSLDYVKNLIQNEGLPKASDVALMQRMIQEASKRGDAETVQNLIMDTAILGTDLGQATQALSIIQRLTPEGQLKMYTKLVNRAKARGEKSFENVEITPEMVKKVLDAYNEDGTYDQNDLNARVEEFKQDLANQMKSTVGEKIDAWRYLSMLGNPKTHIRNMVSNIAMTGTVKVKNAMARTLETILPVKDRTKTWKKASQEIKDYAAKTTQEMKGIITGESKYNEKSAIESKKEIFKNKTLEKISNFNSAALEGEDWFFSSRAFKSTFQEYLTANGINTMEDIKNNPEIVEKAKNYAVEQAEIATFRQYSKLASMINQFERKGKVGKIAVEALMPFKKTPINVAKAGVNYSPLGLIKNITYDAYQLKQGNINASQFIDNISQGMTGTSLTLLGYALAKAGILSGSGSDDKEGKYDKQLGKSGYSVNLGGKSYSISWLSPVAMPLLVGTNAYEQLEEQKDWDMNVVSDTLAKTLDPLNEMSFMQGLTNALQSYGGGADKIKGSLESALQNYVGQFFPTLFSQIASVTDDKKRSTRPSNNSKYKFGEQTARSIMYKIPGLRQQLEPVTDIWGNEKLQSTDILERAFETFLAPYSKTEDITTDLDKELKRVYNEVGETKVIPGIPNSYVKYQNETYRMSAKEYTQYKKTYGQTANETLNDLINSESYQNASEEDKTKMIENVYDYAKAEANKEYFDNNNVEYTNKTLTKLDKLNEEFGINPNEYFENKNEYDYAYKNPEKYKTIKQITSYNNYNTYKNKIKEIKDNTTNDKQETIKYINSLKLSVPQKAMFIKQYYKSFTDYDNEIINYINSKKISSKDKTAILEQLGFTVRNGRVYTK